MIPYILTLIAPATPIQHAPIEMSGDAAERTYEIAKIIMKLSEGLLDIFGLEHHHTLLMTVFACFVFIISFGVGWILQKILVKILWMLEGKIDNNLYRHLRETHFFTKSCRIIPPIVFMVLIEFTMSGKLLFYLTTADIIYMVIIIAIALTSMIEATWQHIDEQDNKRKLPLKGIVQLVKGVIWIIAVIIIFAILLDKSPAKLLAGLGAFAAVLMLIFKDSILGVVAGVQLSQNDSLHVGDWIKVHGTDANGTVSEVTLTSVKVINWDKTITTVPPYTLISGSFTNYRNMQQSNTRRICRFYYIDADSIAPLNSPALERFKELPQLKEYIEQKQKQNAGQPGDYASLVDGSIETNLGLFRAYLQLYLNGRKDIDQSSTCFVTTLQQTPTGIPLQVYCFTSTSSWLPYEAIQASIFEHIAVMLHRFGLYLYESPSGRDTILEGYLPAAGIDKTFGVPFPLNVPADVALPVGFATGQETPYQPISGTDNSNTPKAQPAASAPAPDSAATQSSPAPPAPSDAAK